MASRTCLVKTLFVTGWVVLISVLLTASFISAQDRKLSRAKISFSEIMWDFGYVPRTGKVVHTYHIKNIGQDTLIVAKVRTTCGCTTTPLTSEIIAPDETTDMKVYFDPKKIAIGDEITRKLQVISNDPVNPFAEVQFSAKMGKTSSLIKITPQEIDFDTIFRGAEEVRTLTIENISGENLSMEQIEGPGEDVDLDLKNNNLKPGESIKVSLKLKNEAPPGNLHTSLTLDFECSKRARVSIPIQAVIIQN
jgi:hypothetical protein